MTWFAEQPIVFRYFLYGGIGLGVVGAVVGFALGISHPPTVWFAVLEVGVPGGLLGAVLGTIAGLIRLAVTTLVKAVRN